MTVSTPGPRGQAPGAADRDAENVRAAARLRDQRPGWVIVVRPRCAATPPRRCSARRAAPT